MTTTGRAGKGRREEKTGADQTATQLRCSNGTKSMTDGKKRIENTPETSFGLGPIHRPRCTNSETETMHENNPR